MANGWKKTKSNFSDSNYYTKNFGNYSEVTIDIEKINVVDRQTGKIISVGYKAQIGSRPTSWLAEFKAIEIRRFEYNGILGKTEVEVLRRAKKMVETYWKMYNKKW